MRFANTPKTFTVVAFSLSLLANGCAEQVSNEPSQPSDTSPASEDENTEITGSAKDSQQVAVAQDTIEISSIKDEHDADIEPESNREFSPDITPAQPDSDTKDTMPGQADSTDIPDTETDVAWNTQDSALSSDSSDSGDSTPPPLAFEVTDYWPTTFERGRSHPLVLRGQQLDKVLSIAVSDEESSTVHWDQRELLANHSVLRVNITVEHNREPGPLNFSIQLPEEQVQHTAEVVLLPGELQAMIGTLDLGETDEPTPWEDAEFFQAVAVETGGGFLYFTDAGWNRIYATNLSLSPKKLMGKDLMPAMVYPIAGSGEAGPSVDGPALAIPLSEPKGLCYTVKDGVPLLFLADTTHHQIRVMNLGEETATEQGLEIPPGEIVTLAGTGTFGYSGDEGPALAAKMFRPWRIKGCNTPLLLFGDVENYRLRAINRTGDPVTISGEPLEPGFIRTIAGTGTLGYSGDGGPAASADISIPKGMITLPNGLILFSDPENDRIRVLNPGDETQQFGATEVQPSHIETVAFPGSFNGIEALPGLFHPTGLYPDPLGAIWIADTYSHTIKAINGADAPLYRAGKIVLPGITPTIAAGIEHFHAGTEGTTWGTEAYMSSPFDVALDETRGELFIADEENRVIRRLKLWSPRPLLQGKQGPFPDLNEITGDEIILDVDTGTLTATGEDWIKYIGSRHGIMDLSSFHIPANKSLRIVGKTPACISSTGPMLIEGTLLIEAGSIEIPQGSDVLAGGSHATAGAAQPPSTVYGSSSLVPFSGGMAGGGGAQGGGALMLVSQSPIVIKGTLFANGLTSPKSEGSGSGGAIKIVSEKEIQCSGLLSALGGGGPYPGGNGRIRLEAPIIDCQTSPTADVESKPVVSNLPGY